MSGTKESRGRSNMERWAWEYVDYDLLGCLRRRSRQTSSEALHRQQQNNVHALLLPFFHSSSFFVCDEDLFILVSITVYDCYNFCTTGNYCCCCCCCCCYVVKPRNLRQVMNNDDVDDDGKARWIDSELSRGEAGQVVAGRGAGAAGGVSWTMKLNRWCSMSVVQYIALIGTTPFFDKYKQYEVCIIKFRNVEHNTMIQTTHSKL